MELIYEKGWNRMNASEALRRFGAVLGGGIAFLGLSEGWEWERVAGFTLIGALVYWIFSGFSAPK
jgi:hypothetical protein